MAESRDAPRPADLLPLPSHVFQILLSLFEHPLHGYALLKDIERRTGGETALGTSTLYAALRRMLGLGLIAETGPPPGTASHDARRRYYRATPLGRRAARAEAQRIRRLSDMIAEVPLLATGPGRRGSR